MNTKRPFEDPPAPIAEVKIYCGVDDMITVEFMIGKKIAKMKYDIGQEDDMATLIRNFNLTTFDTTTGTNKHPWNAEQYLTVCRAILKAYPRIH